MKYVKTKDAIYKVRKPALDEYLWEDSTYVYGHEHIKNSEIIEQADTIEELCDEFVYISNLRTWLSPLKTLDGVYLFNKNETLLDVYGAIWTDKGLIYVAKMNEKGELELL